MKKVLLGLLFLGSIAITSCETEEAPIEESKITFTYEMDGVEMSYTSNCYWYEHPDNGTPYYIKGWGDSENWFMLTVPELTAKTWTSDDAEETAALEFIISGTGYGSGWGGDEYVITITKYDSETGRLEGSFSGVGAAYDFWNDALYYKAITNGVFVVEED